MLLNELFPYALSGDGDCTSESESDELLLLPLDLELLLDSSLYILRLDFEYFVFHDNVSFLFPSKPDFFFFLPCLLLGARNLCSEESVSAIVIRA